MAPRYRRQSLPSRSGAGVILNHSWKNRLRVGVRTSASVSSVNPEARSFRNGSRSAAARQPCTPATGSSEDVSGVTASSRGRNSAGPTGLLEISTVSYNAHSLGWGNIVGSSSVIPMYDMTSPRHLSAVAVQAALSFASRA